MYWRANIWVLYRKLHTPLYTKNYPLLFYQKGDFFQQQSCKPGSVFAAIVIGTTSIINLALPLLTGSINLPILTIIRQWRMIQKRVTPGSGPSWFFNS